jgi:selenocysteine lyase/cysteine desulfurase
VARPAVLAAYARQRLAVIDGLELQGDEAPGTIGFVLRQQPAAAVVAVLAAEFGIRLQHSRGGLPDRVWLHLGPQDTWGDIDTIADALQMIARGEFEGVYVHEPSSGDYVALGAPLPARRPTGVPPLTDSAP